MKPSIRPETATDHDAIRQALLRRCIGPVLVRAGLSACRDAGHRIVVVLGHPGSYPRFGFSARMAERPRSP